jgi:HK97 family phage portal protein
MPAGLLERLMGLPPASASYGPGDDYWYGPVGQVSAAGINVTPEAAMRVAAVFACVRVIAEDIASVPLDVFRRQDQGGKQRIPFDALPLARILSKKPNRWQNSMEWREMSTGHVLLRGNAYSRIISGERGFVDQLLPLNPDRMKVDRLPSGSLRYTYSNPATNTKDLYAQEEIFHLRGLSSDGMTGISVIALARETIGLAIAAQRHAAKTLANGGRPSIVIKRPTAAPSWSKEARTNFKATWREAHGGPDNAGNTAILEEGMEIQQMGMTAEDLQFVQTYKLQLDEIPRFFRMQPHMIGILDHATFTNIEHQSLEYVTRTLRPWAVRWEMALFDQLIISDRIFAEFNLEGLQRGDAAGRATFYRTMWEIGALNDDEIRDKENMNKRDDGLGGTYMRPANIVPAATPADAIGRAASAPRAENPRLRLIAESAAQRLVRKEADRVGKAAKKHADDAEGWTAFLDTFYAEHAQDITRTLHIGEHEARAYADRQLAGLRSGAGVAVMETWFDERPAELAKLALEETA